MVVLFIYLLFQNIWFLCRGACEVLCKILEIKVNFEVNFWNNVLWRSVKTQIVYLGAVAQNIRDWNIKAESARLYNKTLSYSQIVNMNLKTYILI